MVSDCENITNIDTRFYATDKYSIYDIITYIKHLIGESHTFIPLNE